MAKKTEKTAVKKSTYKTTPERIKLCEERIKSIKTKIVELGKKLKEQEANLAKLQTKANRKERMDFMKQMTNEEMAAMQAWLAEQRSKKNIIAE